MQSRGITFTAPIDFAKKNSRAVLLLSTLLLIASCSSSTPAPVVDLNRIESSSANQYSQQTEKTHLVRPGETLFSIAWRYSLDHKQLAKINGIKENRIYPGQTLQLQQDNTKPFDSERLIAAINKDVLHKKAPVSYPAAARPSNQSNSKKSVQANKHKIASVSKPTKHTSHKTSSTKSTSSASKNKIKNKVYASSNPSVNRWIWPVDGKIIDGFSKQSNKNKGLDISGKKGTPIRATAKGRVVYSGSGLRGYGQLVIIKHNENYISAYAHNDKIHVKENEYVKAGQRIADLGSSGANREKLHFEIRYKGKPVDPLNYLPKTGHL